MSEHSMKIQDQGPVSAIRGEKNESSAALEVTSPPRALTIVFAVLCALGIGVSVELTRIHLFVHTDPSYHSVCAMSEGVNCETVAVSPYSVFAGLPVSLWGLAGYLVMGGLALSACFRRKPHPAWPLGLLLLSTGFSVLVSAILAFISSTRIDSFCLFCMASYAINVVLLVICLIAWRRSRTGALKLALLDVKAALARPKVFVPAAVVGLVSVGVLQAAVPPYWETPGWTDIPRLASGVDDDGHHWTGAEEPTLTIVEFSDYECPHCRAAHKDMRLVAAQYPDRIRLVHRHLPLDQACHPGLRRPFHHHACRFAEGAECAALQGRFWEMNDALFSIQERVRTDDVDPEELAVRLGLNRLDFKRCLDEHETAGRVADDLQEAMRRQLRGTPSFLVGEQLFLGRIPDGELERLLSEQSP